MARKTWAKIPLPTTEPTGTVCVKINVPDQFEHRTAFADAIYKLSRAYYWADDTAHTAVPTAAIWNDIFNDVCAQLDERKEVCDMFDIRQNTENPCILEKTTDGITWTAFADLQACPPLLRYGPDGRINSGYHTGEDVTFFEVPDGPWIDDTPQQIFAAIPASTSMNKQNNDQCVAAANTTNALREFVRSVGSTLDQNVNATVNTTAVGAIIGELYGVPIAGWAEAAITAFFILEQVSFALVQFTEDDFRKVTCMIYNNMTGTSGHWNLDFTDIQASFTGLGLSFGLDGILSDVLDFIAPEGLDLFAKTTMITDYDCAAEIQPFLIGNYRDRRFIGNNAQWQLLWSEPLKYPFALFRLNYTGDTIPGTGAQVGRNTNLAPPAGYVNATFANIPPLSVTNTSREMWGYSSHIFSTTAQAIAAVRVITGDPTYSPNMQNMGNLIVNPGQTFFMGLGSASISAAFWSQLDFKFYGALTFAGC